jgi:hypothetical protein
LFIPSIGKELMEKVDILMRSLIINSLDEMSKDSFSTPLTAFFVRQESPVPSDQDDELFRQLLLWSCRAVVFAQLSIVRE